MAQTTFENKKNADSPCKCHIDFDAVKVHLDYRHEGVVNGAKFTHFTLSPEKSNKRPEIDSINFSIKLHSLMSYKGFMCSNESLIQIEDLGRSNNIHLYCKCIKKWLYGAVCKNFDLKVWHLIYPVVENELL